MKAISDVTVVMQFQEEITKDEYIKLIKEKPLEERKICFSKEIIEKLTHELGAREVRVHEYKLTVEEDSNAKDYVRKERNMSS